MKKLVEALKTAEAGLREVVELDSAPVKHPRGTVQGKLMKVLETLLHELQPMMELEASKPAWMTQTERIIDYEVLTVISHELSGVGDKIQIEDSRSLEQLCMDAAELFTKHHFSKDEQYWGERMFLDEVMKLAYDIVAALVWNPAWINTDYKAMHGSDTVEDLLRRYYEDKFPLTAMQTKEVQMDRRRLVFMKDLAGFLEEIHPDVAKQIYRILDPTDNAQADPTQINHQFMRMEINDNLLITVDRKSGKYVALFDQGDGTAKGSVSYTAAASME